MIPSEHGCSLINMNELINLIVQKTGISEEQAQTAVNAVIGHLKERLPAAIAGHVDSVLAGNSGSLMTEVEGAGAAFIEGKLGGLFGSKPQ